MAKDKLRKKDMLFTTITYKEAVELDKPVTNMIIKSIDSGKYNMVMK